MVSLLIWSAFRRTWHDTQAPLSLGGRERGGTARRFHIGSRSRGWRVCVDVWIGIRRVDREKIGEPRPRLPCKGSNQVRRMTTPSPTRNVRRASRRGLRPKSACPECGRLLLELLCRFRPGFSFGIRGRDGGGSWRRSREQSMKWFARRNRRGSGGGNPSHRPLREDGNVRRRLQRVPDRRGDWVRTLQANWFCHRSW